TTTQLTYIFQDQSTYTLCHTFGYGSREPWITNPADIYPCAPITFNGSVFDPGMDDINATIQLKTYINLEIDFFLAFLLEILDCFPFSYDFDITEDTHVQVEGWITDDDIIHITIEGRTNLTEISFDNDGMWPVALPLSATSRIPNLDFLEIIVKFPRELVGVSS
ncbi:MAG: hypothetical protein ACTSQQ_13550, partial [Candidatus Helarchaeota archaeon]